MKILLAIFLALFLIGCNDTSQIVKHVENGVVLITNEKSADSGGIGAGFILEDNQIVTNHHVVENAQKLNVYSKNSNRRYEAVVVYEDKIADIAVLRLREWDMFKFYESPVNLKLGDSNTSVPGSKVIVIGHPWGLDWTVSQGIISAKNRRPQPTPKFLDQIDAKLFQGNSGGPIFNEREEVVCVSNLMIVVEKGGGSYGFCIPSNLVKKVIYDLNKFNEVKWRALNISMKPSDDGLSVAVNSVDENGAADKAGIKVGDKILRYYRDNNSVREINEADDLLSELAVLRGDHEDVKLLVERNGEKFFIIVKTGYRTAKDFEQKTEPK